MIARTGISGLNYVINSTLRKSDKRNLVIDKVNKIIEGYKKVNRTAFVNEINFLMSYKVSNGKKTRILKNAGRKYPEFDLIEKRGNDIIPIALIRDEPITDIDCISHYYNIKFENGYNQIIILSLGNLTQRAKEDAAYKGIILWDRAWLQELYYENLNICAERRIEQEERRQRASAAFDSFLDSTNAMLDLFDSVSGSGRKQKSPIIKRDLWADVDNSLHGEEDPDMHPVDEDGYCLECDEYIGDMM